MNKLNRNQIYTQIRKLIGFPDSGKTFFSGDEMLSIVQRINPTWKRKPKMQRGRQVTKRCFGDVHKVWITEHKNILPEGVPNWTRQKVVGTHPDLANLRNILSQLKKAKNKKLSPLIQDVKAADKISTKTVELERDCNGDPDLHNITISALTTNPEYNLDICYDIT